MSSYQVDTYPKPVGYNVSEGSMEEPARRDHEHNLIVETFRSLNGLLVNGWTDVNGKFGLDPMGFVHIEGRVDAGTVAAGTTIFTLPVGYRPPINLRHLALTNTGAQACGIVINANGTVTTSGFAAVANLYFNSIFEASRETLVINKFV